MEKTKTDKTSTTDKPLPGQEAEYWREKVNEHKRSGLSQAEFARKHGLKAKTLGRWKSRFEKTKKKKVTLKTAKAVKKPAATVGNKLAVALIQQKKASGSALTRKVELKHASGFSIVLDSHTDEAVLKKVLRSLAEITGK